MTQPSIKDRLHYPRTALANLIVEAFEQNLQTATTIFAPRRKGKIVGAIMFVAALVLSLMAVIPEAP